MAAIVEVNNAVKDYPLGKVVVRALKGVRLSIERGEFTVIAGPSGSGKTTLLNLIGCIDVPSAGEILVDGRSTSKLSDRELTQLRLEKIGFIFQSFNLVNVLNLYQNVELPLLLQGRLSGRERRQRVGELIERVGLAEHQRHRPNELSGGQRQRVAIARALVTQPALVLADEPTANLDSATGASIIALMRELNEAEKTTFLFSTHDPAVMKHARRLIRLVDGKLAEAA
jgi:putative ABC transport system ATP-binding protein